MDLLVLGGTQFLGRVCVEEALARGHIVTTFNRGLSGPDQPEVEALHGDRTVEDDLEGLRGRRFDAVIDTSGFVPRVVRASAVALAPGAAAYCFVSSVSVYPGWPTAPCDESSPRHDCPPDAGPVDGDYGALKAGCERAVEAAYAGRALVVRPGLILGPHENVGRLPAWLERISRGGRVLAPGRPEERLQLVDARDIAVWTLDALRRGLGGVVNVTGPQGNATFGSLLGSCVEVTGSTAELVWVDDDFLLAAGVELWTELPLWMPMNGTADHAWRVSTAAAEAEGFACRQVSQTVHDTWTWLQAEGPVPQRPDRPRHGIDPEKEQLILASWDAR